MSLSKKGFQITEVPTLAVVLLVIAIVLGIGASVLVQVQDTTLTAASTSETDSNSVTTTNGTQVLFSDLDAKSNVPSCSGVKIYNGSNALDVTNYFTISGCYATLNEAQLNTSGRAKEFNYTKTLVSYTTAYNITQTGLTSQVSFSNWEGTWIVIIAAAVVIGIVGKYLFFGGSQ